MVGIDGVGGEAQSNQNQFHNLIFRVKFRMNRRIMSILGIINILEINGKCMAQVVGIK
jgi:hypothetical protein